MRAGNILGTISELSRHGLLEKKVVQEAEEELSVTHLLQDVGARLGRGIAEELQNGHDVLSESVDDGGGSTGNANWHDLDMSWIAELASIRKWSRLVSDITSRFGLDMHLDTITGNKSTV